MTSKIRIKLGAVEVECDGSEAFLTKELPLLLEAVYKLHRESGGKALSSNGAAVNGVEEEPNGNSHNFGTTGSIASKLKCKSGNDLVIAAAAHLTFVKGRGEFSRQEILDEMKGATGFYKESYGSNLSNYLQGRVKADELLEPRQDIYALKAKKKTELEAALAS